MKELIMVSSAYTEHKLVDDLIEILNQNDKTTLKLDMRHYEVDIDYHNRTGFYLSMAKFNNIISSAYDVDNDIDYILIPDNTICDIFAFFDNVTRGEKVNNIHRICDAYRMDSNFCITFIIIDNDIDYGNKVLKECNEKISKIGNIKSLNGCNTRLLSFKNYSIKNNMLTETIYNSITR